MSKYTLACKPAIGPYGYHDPSVALFDDGRLLFGAEEERYTRDKHAPGSFPGNAIRAALRYADISLPDVHKVVLPYDPELHHKRLRHDLKSTVSEQSHLGIRGWNIVSRAKDVVRDQFFPDEKVRSELEAIGSPIPPINHRSHHLCHAASAFHPSPFDTAVVITMDGRGEFDSTVVWTGSESGLERRRTFAHPNSLGHFYGIVTEYLGYESFNGEGKIMGLAPYGERNDTIESRLRSVADFGPDYDVRTLTSNGIEAGVTSLEELFDRPAKQRGEEFQQFEKDLAHTAQKLLEETVSGLVRRHTTRTGIHDVALSGGVALNCKMNKRVRETDPVENLFIQPVAHDAGLALGAGWLETDPQSVEPMRDVYWGESPDTETVTTLLENNKLSYTRREDVERYTAERIADGDLVGWMQGRQEMGPRALGNRSILADPRTATSRDRVNRYVKNREEWRPFAPSILAEAASDYLVDDEASPYMIQTFDTVPERREDLAAVVHPGDTTTRPQTVTEEQNPRYHGLISEFENITGVPAVLNTSFNDHGEPIVTTPKEAVRDFYGMGLDVLVIEDIIVEK